MVLLFGVGLVIWIQGNLLVADYGAFTGVPIDWTIESWRNPYEIALWIARPGAGVAAAKYVVRIAPFASGVLVALQAAALITSVVSADSSTTARWQGPAESMFELSRTRNVIHIVLDAFQSDVFGEILAEERPLLDRSLSGAVFFANHTGAFPTTIASIPAMLTGKVYRNDRPLQRYMRDILKEASIFKSLRANGYRVDAASRHVSRQRIGDELLSSAAAVCELRRVRTVHRMAACRFVALQARAAHTAACHSQQRIVAASSDASGQEIRARGSTTRSTARSCSIEFAKRLRPATDEPVSKYIHVGIPHRPVVVNGNCEFIGVVRATRAAYKEQARCAVKRVAEILDRLKDIGVYDNTLVVISSDHGIGLPPPQFVNNRQTPMGAVARIAGNAMALLVVKPLNSDGPVRTSHAPTTITDIPATILDGVGVAQDLPGEPALKLSENASARAPMGVLRLGARRLGAELLSTLSTSWRSTAVCSMETTGR